MKGCTVKQTKKPEIDVGLAALCSVANGQALSCADIAEVCGCSEQRIRKIEEQALMKLRHPCRANRLLEAAELVAV